MLGTVLGAQAATVNTIDKRPGFRRAFFQNTVYPHFCFILEMRMKYCAVTGKEQQCLWNSVTPNFHCFAEHTALFVGGIKEAAMFSMHVESRRFSSTYQQALVHVTPQLGRGGRQPNSLCKPLTIRIVWIKYKVLFHVMSCVYAGSPYTPLN